MLTTDFVQAYCWELSLDSVDGQHHAEQAEPAADAKPAEEAEPAAVAEDAKPADDKPAEDAQDAFTSRIYAALRVFDKERAARHAGEQAEDDKPAAPEEAEDANPADDKAAEAEPAAQPAEDVEMPAEEAEDDKAAEAEPAAVAEAADAPAPPAPADSSQGAGPVQGLRTTDKGDGWHELLARTLEEYTADLEIIKRSVNDGTIDKVSVRWSPTRWTQEIYYINSQQKLALKSAKRSVLPRDALVQVHVA